MSLISSSYSNGVVTVKFRIYYYNDGDTYDNATIYYQIGGNGYYSQSVSAYGGDYGYITCNMSISIGATSATSYTFNVNGYVDSTNCGNDHFGQNLTATWEKIRPSYFYWINSSTNLQKGQAISNYITASKWTELQNNVNKVREFYGYATVSFTTVTRGVTVIRADLYKEIMDAINSTITGSVKYSNGTAVTAPVKGRTQITADIMMALQRGVNGITG
jgi:hypothetical protein